MKKLISSLVALVVVTYSPIVTAGPLNPSEVPANPAWVIHIDADTLRDTYVGRYLLYLMNKPEMYSNRLAFQSMFSFDVRTQFHGVTVYAASATPGDAVSIIDADVAPAHLVDVVRPRKDFQILTHHGHKVYTWIEKGSAGDGRKYACFEANRMISGLRREPFLAAMDVLDKAAPNLALNKSWEDTGDAGASDFALGAGRKLDFPSADPTLALLKMAREIKFRAAEKDEQVTAVLTAVTDDDFTAREMSIAGQGFVALLRLQKERPRAIKLAGKIKFRVNGSLLTVTLSAPSADLTAALKEYYQKNSK